MPSASPPLRFYECSLPTRFVFVNTVNPTHANIPPLKSSWQIPPKNYQPLHAMSAAGGGALLNDGKMGAMQNPGLLDQMEKPSLAAHSTTGRGLNGDDALSSNATHSQLRRSGNNSTSFEALLTLDFESMQSMENLEQIKKQGPKAMEKNVSWGSESNYPNAKLSNGGQVLPNGAGKHAGHEQGRSDANGRYGSVGTALRNFSSSKLSANAANSFRGPSMDYQELYRVHSSTGLTALREQQGLNARNSSVDGKWLAAMESKVK